MSNVNTYRVIDFIMPFLPEPIGDSMVLAQRHLNELVAAYDALAPDWANAPDDAKWYTIDKFSGAFFFDDEEPLIDEEESCWFVSHVGSKTALDVGIVDLPLGIDWRLCKWQRPEAA